jgi:hypothetical protein
VTLGATATNPRASSMGSPEGSSIPDSRFPIPDV